MQRGKGSLVLFWVGLLVLIKAAPEPLQVGQSCTVNESCGSLNCDCNGMTMVCVCAAVPLGLHCTYDMDCTSSTCHIIGGRGTCSLGPVGAVCASDDDCSSGRCSGTCMPQNVDFDLSDSVGVCHVNSDCTSGLCRDGNCRPVAHDPAWSATANQCDVPFDCLSRRCQANAGGFKSCRQNSPEDPMIVVLPQCGANSDCTSGRCDVSKGPFFGTCLAAPTGSPCVVARDCETVNCIPLGRGVCSPNVPSAEVTAARCVTNADCTSHICDHDFYQEISGGIGRCKADVGEVCVYRGMLGPSPFSVYCLTGLCQFEAMVPNEGDIGECIKSYAGVSAGTESPLRGFCYHDSDCVNNRCSVHNAADTYAFSGHCLPAEVGSMCLRDEDCSSNNCVDFICAVNGAGTGNCLVDSDCVTQVCDCSDDLLNCETDIMTGIHYGSCLAVGPGSPCVVDGDCAVNGSVCDPLALVCTALAAEAACLDSGDCASNFCDVGVTDTCQLCTAALQCGSGVCGRDGVCARNFVGGPCAGASDCSTRICSGFCQISFVGGFCESELDCPSQHCEYGRCKANGFGGPCLADEDCVTGSCSSCDARGTGDCTGQRGTCQAVHAGQRCVIHADCTSGVCTEGVCQVAALNGHCAVDSDCASYLFCSPPVSKSLCQDREFEDIDYPHCDFNPCHTQNGFCDDHASCTPQACRRRTCTCFEGWFGRGNLLTPDIQAELSRGHHRHMSRDQMPGCHTPCTPSTCDVNAVCVATSFTITTCQCNPGFIGDGRPGTCVVDPCYPDTSGHVAVCSLPNQLCTVADPGNWFIAVTGAVPIAIHQCVCKPGFYAVAGECARKGRDSCSPANQAAFGGPLFCACGSTQFSGLVASYGGISVCTPNGVVGTDGLAGVCLENSDCTTLNCAFNPQALARGVQKTCQLSEVDQPCFYHTDCASGNCDTHFSLRCLANGYKGACATDRDCTDGFFCLDPAESIGQPNAHHHSSPHTDHHGRALRKPKYCALNLCASNNGGCDPVGLCTPVDHNLRICTCPASHFGSGYAFDPDVPGSGCVNLCEQNNGGCFASVTDVAFCVAQSYQSVMCLCPAPLVGNGVGDWGCREDVCASLSPPYTQPGQLARTFWGCPANSTCTTSHAGQSETAYATCVCLHANHVFVEPVAPSNTNRGACVVDPCVRRNGGCPDNAVCTAAPVTGLATCTCRPGYAPHNTAFLPGTAFCALDPCHTFGVDGLPTNGGCDVNAQCAATGDASRSCTCNVGFVGDGFACVLNPCLESSMSVTPFCAAYAHTECQAVFHAAQGSNGPANGRGPTASMQCPCAPGYHPVNRNDPVNFAPCTPSCDTQNGNCDAASTTCALVGNDVRCTCKRGYFYQASLATPPQFGAVVPPATPCFVANCDYATIQARVDALNANAGDCVSVAAGGACHLGCGPSFVAVSEAATRVECVATNTGASFVWPKQKKVCISATQSPTLPAPARTPKGNGWDCTAAKKGKAAVCRPKKPTVHKAWSEANHTASASVSWKGLGTSVPVVALKIVLSGEVADLIGVVQTPANPQPDPSMPGTTHFTGLHAGKRYSVTVVATVRTSALGAPVETVDYVTEPLAITACSALC